MYFIVLFSFFFKETGQQSKTPKGESCVGHKEGYRPWPKCRALPLGMPQSSQRPLSVS